MYLACTVNPLKGPELSTLNFARTLVFEVFRPGMTQTILSSYMVRSDGADALTDVYIRLSYDVASGSEITPCNKIDKPLVVYRFTGNVMTSISTLRTEQNYDVFYARNEISKYMSYDK